MRKIFSREIYIILYKTTYWLTERRKKEFLKFTYYSGWNYVHGGRYYRSNWGTKACVHEDVFFLHVLKKLGMH